ncbi:amino acid ABC transporter substrate-binding protein [Haloplasma contractile]|uniref:Amino acid ABC transporter amino acid-binding protein n=1 Tax=Haloplasma contractile SSD-17B TaxID=1033810 RepID=U2FIU3_9MOLU|nr:amino acid ABC transporter substrate-binding protein [Haloplasma contractile]ERJ11174.1 Amino acid ABC transporter amino acid-binding protein [Haloplasma contractile SSD-17B]
MKKAKVLLGLMILAVVFTLVGCQGDEAPNYEQIQDRGYIVMGLDDSFAPMGFRDEDNEIVGFDVDMAKELFERLDLEVRFQPIDWSMKETELNSGNIDLIWNGYTITDERKEKVDFSTPYLANRQVIVVLTDSGISSKADLSGKKVAVQEASSSLDAVNKESDVVQAFDGGEALQYGTNDEALRELEFGRVDAVVVDEILARYYISLKEDGLYTVLTDDFGREEYGIGVRKENDALLDAINDELASMKADGASATISNEWFGEDIVQ